MRLGPTTRSATDGYAVVTRQVDQRHPVRYGGKPTLSGGR